MKIYGIGEEDYEGAAQSLIDDGIVGFDTMASFVKKIYSQVYEHLERKGHDKDDIIEDFTMTDDGYVYFLRDQGRYNHNQGVSVVKMAAKRSAD